MLIQPHAAIVMKVGPHSNMTLSDIIESKQQDVLTHGVHYWWYSGVFCQPRPTQEFCKMAREKYRENPSIILIETKSPYKSNIGYITQYSIDNKVYVPFRAPVQLQGAQFSFVAKDIKHLETFVPAMYKVYGGKNHGKSLLDHMRFRVNKSFAILNTSQDVSEESSAAINVLVAELVEPYAIWLKE